VAASYESIAAQLVSRLKFARTQAAAHLIAQIMDARLPATSVETVVVHIPTATQRVRQRGYDQAQLIAREFARCRQLPCQALLRRRGHTRQVGANRQERQEQLRTAFYCPRPERLVGRRILLIDDVLTTGATIEAAAKVCVDAGAEQVVAVLFAQKL
jgi:ComF family protein